MRRKTILLITVAILTVLALSTAAAQGRVPLLAYVNAGTQLVITGADGNFRWVVTSPGEQLAPDVNLAWSPDGARLFFAVRTASGTSLRTAAPSSQMMSEFATVGGAVQGGEWHNNSIVLATLDGIVQVNVETGAASVVAPGGQAINEQMVSPDGDFLFYHNGSGFALTPLNDFSEMALPGRNDATAAGVGVWAEDAPLVAYWTFGAAGTSVLNVTNATTGDTLTLDSDSAVPVTPLAWLQNTLIYRSATGVFALDGRSGASVPILPVTASHIRLTDTGVLIYTDNGVVFGAGAACIATGDCIANAVPLGSTSGTLAVNGNTTAFTAPDGTVQAVALGCVDAGTCSPTATGISGMVVSVSPDGNFVLAASQGAAQMINLAVADASVYLRGVSVPERAVWGG